MLFKIIPLITTLILLGVLILNGESNMGMGALALLGLAWFFQVIYSQRKQNNTRKGGASKEDEEAKDSRLQSDLLLKNEMWNLISDESVSIASDFERVKDLIRQASGELQTSFNGLNDEAKHQVASLLMLAAELRGDRENGATGDIQFQTFAGSTQNVLEQFVSELVATSKDSMEIMSVVNDLATQMNSVKNMLTDIQKIAEQTNLLALNAAIEAARAGEAGRGFAVVADEVRNLSNNSNDFSDQINAVMGEALTNLSHAQNVVSKIASKDITFAIESKQDVDNMIESMSNLNQKIENKITHVTGISENISSMVNAAVRALQFEDIVGQLADHNMKRLTRMKELMSEVNHAVNSSDISDEEMHSIQSLMNSLRAELQAFNRSRTDEKDNPVLQKTMDEGDVDLF